MAGVFYYAAFAGTARFMHSSPFSTQLAVFAAAGVCSLWNLANAQAALDWPQKTVEAKATADTPVVEIKFPFKNTGSIPVDVTQVESSCGCTTVALEKRHYAPGEGGEIVARYTVADHAGVQKKNVLVATGDGAEPTELTLVVNIPEILRITPAFVTWKHAEAPKAKIVTLEMMQETPIKDISVQASNGAVTAALETLVKGRKYQMVVTPSTTNTNLFSTLSIRCQFGDKERVFRSYATVQPAIPAE